MVLTSTTTAASERKRSREARRSCWRRESGNGGVGGVCCRRGSGGGSGELALRAGGSCCCCSAAERAEGVMGRRQRCGAEEGARVEVKPGHGCRAAGDADAWSPRGESFLTRSGRGAARGRRSQRAGLGRGEVGWSGAGASLARWADFGRRARSEAAAREGEKSFFQIYFQGIFKCHLSNIILSKKMTSFENVPKMKVA